MIKYKNMPKLFWVTGRYGSGTVEIADYIKKTLVREQTIVQQNIIAKEMWGSNVPNCKFVLIHEHELRSIYQLHDYSEKGIVDFVAFVQILCGFMIKNNIIPIVSILSPFYEQRKTFIDENDGVEICVYNKNTTFNSENYMVNYEDSSESENSIKLDITEKSVDECFDDLWNLFMNK